MAVRIDLDCQRLALDAEFPGCCQDIILHFVARSYLERVSVLFAVNDFRRRRLDQFQSASDGDSHRRFVVEGHGEVIEGACLRLVSVCDFAVFCFVGEQPGSVLVLDEVFLHGRILRVRCCCDWYC